MNSLSSYRFAGYVLSRTIERPDFVDTSLLPDTLVSLSSCISQFYPDTWALSWCGDSHEHRVEYATLFGIEEGDIIECIALADKHFGTQSGWEHVIYSLEAAHEFASRCSSEMLRLLGVALHQSMQEQFLKVAAPAPPKPGVAPAGAHGFYHMLTRDDCPPEPETILGFEPLVYNHGLSCSWLCNGLETICNETLGITPNKYGLIETQEEAENVCACISQDDVGAEPGLWLPWLLLEYPL